ncbi:DUF1707 SHOCT-like domain-containing protein [Streptomyces mashuensis]|uniref:DUF1707 SHOCT-like domain-containing protein n=1 Tax=Streptomyces mashuensis TaxID=33904 RepID=UPI00167D49CC|nr:DUF1707 domain-containing protein [Streptomyces mashuensis]
MSLTKDTAAGAAAGRPALRASDADRDQVAGILREALAEGRLTADEHAERIGAVYEARTHAELQRLVSDLPAGATAGPAAGSRATVRPDDASMRPGVSRSENLAAVFGGAVRRGRWRPGPTINAFALFGGVEIDLTEAIFEHREIVINANVLFGGAEIKLPENVTVRGAGTGIFGGFDVRTNEADDPDAPVVVVTGYALFGGVEAKPRRGKRLKNLLAAR